MKACRDEFEAAMAQLAPAPMQAAPNAYIVLFNFDK